MIVMTDGAKVTIKKPVVSGPVFTVKYGTDIISFDGEVYAEDQFSTVEGVGWDPVEQKIISETSSPASLNSQGNLTPGNLSSAAGADTVTLQTDALSDAGVLKNWVDATLLKTGLARYRGTFSFCGNAAAVPGCVIKLEGMGARFNGDVFVGAVTHRVDNGTWITEVEMGISPMNITQRADAVAPPASGLYPGIEGLHIGIVEALAGDPASGSRIKVQIPLLNTKPDTVWARLSQFAASNGVGSFFVPSVGDEVILGFLNNDPHQAIILGCLYSAKNIPAYEITDDNYKRAFISPEKLKIELDDEKKIITVITPGANSIVINDDDKSITLKDQNKNQIVMGEKGIEISSGKDIILKAKGNISLDTTGKMNIKAKQDTIIEGMNVTAKAQTSLKVTGSASAEISASSQTTVKGGMVMIN
ncbi:MAG: phage baseplate assembly protein V [Bacteroides sp.]|nr:phage baseplate assembly protein V [Bacteroides sp.]